MNGGPRRRWLFGEATGFCAVSSLSLRRRRGGGGVVYCSKKWPLWERRDGVCVYVLRGTSWGVLWVVCRNDSLIGEREMAT